MSTTRPRVAIVPEVQVVDQGSGTGMGSGRAISQVAVLLGLVIQGTVKDLYKTMHALEALVGKDQMLGIFNEAMAALGLKSRASIADLTEESAPAPRVHSGGRRKKKKTVSPEGRERIRQAQLKRWAKIHAAQGKSAQGKSARKSARKK